MLSSVKNGADLVTKTGNYTYSNKTLTFKSAYLSTLTNGVAVFTVTMSNGDTAMVTITIGD